MLPVTAYRGANKRKTIFSGFTKFFLIGEYKPNIGEYIICIYTSMYECVYIYI